MTSWALSRAFPLPFQKGFCYQPVFIESNPIRSQPHAQTQIASRAQAGETGRIGNESWKVGGFRPFNPYWEKFPCPPESLENVTPAKLAAMAERVRKSLTLMRTLVKAHPHHQDTLAEMLFGLKQVAFVADKIDVSCAVLAEQREGRKKLSSQTKKTVRGLLKQWLAQQDEFEELWMMRNRRSEIAYRLGLYKKRANDYKSLLKR